MAHRHGIGILRREFLQVGFSGLLGLSMPGLAAAAAALDRIGVNPKPRAKALILVFQTGGCSHLDTFDPKPDAPADIRGEFGTIDTAVPGVRFAQHVPQIAARADRMAVIRSLSHIHTNHLNATHWMLTGAAQPGAFFDKIASRDDYPNYAGAIDYLRPRTDGVPTGVNLPTYLMEGPLTWPGQNAGFLGPQHDPWQIKDNPASPNFRVDNASLPAGLGIERLRGRTDLLRRLQDETLASSAVAALDDQRRQALELLNSGRVARAFDLKTEDPRVRDRYGRHAFGQSLLLARRLVQAGVTVVQANMGRVQQWDTHSDNFSNLRDHLLPPLDRGVAALHDDLAALGLLDDTLVIVTGEFGRTPRIGASTGNNNNPRGRDHWAACFSCLVFGAGVRGGQIIGASDKNGAYPSSRRITPADFAATIYHALGIDPATELRDRLARPIRLANGDPVHELWTGAAV
jgi:uncharacterized protein (DUF1501 family)